MTTLRVLTEDLGGSALSRAARAGQLTPAWYPPTPSSAAAWTARAREIGASMANGAWLEALAPAIAATGVAKERMERVAAAGGVLVTTGQQPGLFGGALLTLVKAISTIALADVLERETGVPTAPLFWAATDDADFEETRATAIAVAGGLELLTLEQAPPAGTPMAHAPLGDVSNLLARLETACGSVVDPDVLAMTRRAYAARGTTIGDAYLRLLRELFAPLGLPVIDASHAALRRAAGAVTRRALERAGDVDAALRKRAQEIEAAGFRPQVDYTEGLSLVFTNERGEKRRLQAKEAADARTSIAPEHLSPNVLLRPIVERAVLPTIAYVAGPGEIAYFAQVSTVASALALPQPLAVPRWSTTLLEPRVQRLLERLHVDREEIRDAHAVETRLARAAMPRVVAERIQSLRRDVERDIAALEVADEENLVPPASLQGLRRAMLHRLERLERRYVAAVKRRETQLMRDVATVRASLHPNGVRQERVLNFISFLARYGRGIIEDMHAEASAHAERVVRGGSPSLTTPQSQTVGKA